MQAAAQKRQRSVHEKTPMRKLNGVFAYVSAGSGKGVGHPLT